MQVYRRGDSGPAIAEIRDKLTRLDLLSRPVGGPVDHYDEALDRAVRTFQQGRGLRVDGVVGTETYRALDEARWRLGDRTLSQTVNHPYVGDDVAALQQRLLDLGFDPGRCDGIFGSRTAAALREFQRNVGLTADSGASWTLPRLIGYGRAMEMMLLAQPVEAAALGIEPGAPVMLVERTAYSAAGQPVEHSRDVFRGDRTTVVWESQIR